MRPLLDPLRYQKKINIDSSRFYCKFLFPFSSIPSSDLPCVAFTVCRYTSPLNTINGHALARGKTSRGDAETIRRQPSPPLRANLPPERFAYMSVNERVTPVSFAYTSICACVRLCSCMCVVCVYRKHNAT